jgi:hypothetical protein
MYFKSDRGGLASLETSLEGMENAHLTEPSSIRGKRPGGLDPPHLSSPWKTSVRPRNSVKLRGLTERAACSGALNFARPGADRASVPSARAERAGSARPGPPQPSGWRKGQGSGWSPRAF